MPNYEDMQAGAAWHEVQKEMPYHTAPLRALVKLTLHKDRTLAENVVRLRWRRKRPKPQPKPCGCEPTQICSVCEPEEYYEETQP